MSIPRPPQPAKLFIGLILRNEAQYPDVAASLEERFGPIDLVSPWLAFDWTHYYEKEMGRPLSRRFLAFTKLIEQESLPGIKLQTNEIEQTFAESGRRTVNIDPGYLLRERLVLATGKNFAHRVYIGLHIYADLTLIFQGGKYRKLPWTYPDYADERTLQFISSVREQYVQDLTGAGGTPGDGQGTSFVK